MTVRRGGKAYPVVVAGGRRIAAMSEAAYETIGITGSQGVMTVTLRRPESLNALNAQMRRELLRALKAAARDEAVRAVVLTGEGRAFCAGADLRGGATEREFRRVLTDEYHPLIRALRELPKPVIAAVNGVAAGAGVSLALAADVVIAADDARFVLAFTRIGLIPDSGLTRTLVRALGRHRATELILGAEPMSAAEAAAAGLVSEVVPAAELPAAAERRATALASGPTRAIGLAKRAINAAEDDTLPESLAREAALQELAGRTEDHAEGIAAFTEKREPRFRGR